MARGCLDAQDERLRRMLREGDEEAERLCRDVPLVLLTSERSGGSCRSQLSRAVPASYPAVSRRTWKRSDACESFFSRSAGIGGGESFPDQAKRVFPKQQAWNVQ